MIDKFEENFEDDNEVVTDNSFYINGAISLPEGTDWEEFFDEML